MESYFSVFVEREREREDPAFLFFLLDYQDKYQRR